MVRLDTSQHIGSINEKSNTAYIHWTWLDFKMNDLLFYRHGNSDDDILTMTMCMRTSSTSGILNFKICIKRLN